MSLAWLSLEEMFCLKARDLRDSGEDVGTVDSRPLYAVAVVNAPVTSLLVQVKLEQVQVKVKVQFLSSAVSSPQRAFTLHYPSSSKIRLNSSLVMSIFLYACESWTLRADTERRIRAVEMRCLRKLLGITYRDHISNEEVRNRTRQVIGPHEDFLTTVT